MTLLVDPGKPWRWILLLAERLVRAGVAVEVRLADGPGLSLPYRMLDLVETTLHGGPPERLQDLVPVSAFAPFRTHASVGGAVLDLTGSAGSCTGQPGRRALVPLFDGSSCCDAALAALAEGRRPVLGVREGDRTLVSFPSAIDDITVVSRALDQMFARVATLCFDILMGWRPQPAAGLPDVAAACGTIAPPAALMHIVRHAATKLTDRLTGLLSRPDHWRVGWRKAQGQGLWDTGTWEGEAFSILPDDGRRYFADPFPVAAQGRRFVFVEEYPYATGKGVISVAEVREDGTAGPCKVIIDQPYHMSYPQVFAWGTDHWMIPETTANRTVELWRADAFPDRWSRHAILLDDIAAADATVFFDGNRWWMLASVAPDRGSAGDALHAWYADVPSGPWCMAGRGPVLLDARCARPGGAMRVQSGRWWRPAQDNAAQYGGAIAVCRVDRLDPDGGFQQTVCRQILPPAGYDGFHTLNIGGGLEVVDLCGPRPRFNRGFA
ncbi:MAG: hypothetical protein O9972_26835 [Burkholderiales bacterium]|nr:hypothetical protein [Burkholderiales bacterium]